MLRVGHLYGPGTIYAADGSFTQQVRAGKAPLVGGGTSVFSFSHVARRRHRDRGRRGPTPGRTAQHRRRRAGPDVDLAAVLRRRVGARPPKNVPASLARLAAGSFGVAFMTQLRGADNARARLRLDWRPRYATWRDGFKDLAAHARP